MAGQETIPETDDHSRAVRRHWTGRLPGIRGIAARKRTEDELRLLHALTRAIAEAQDLHSALGVTLGQMCEATGWNYGEAWIPPPDGGALEYSPAWYGSAKSLVEFRRRSAPFKFPLGVGLPGRAWASKRPEWIPDVCTQPPTTYPRTEIALEAGLKAAVSVPIVADGEVLAVLCFLMFESREEDKRFVELASTVAMQLGSLIQRKRAEEALRDSEQRFRLLVETVNAIPWEMDLDTWRFTYAGPQAVKLLGYPLEDWYGEGFWVSHLHPEDLEQAVRFCREATARSEDHEFEYRMLAADGRTVWLGDIVSVVPGEGGPKMLRGIMIDISERRRAEEALREAREELEGKVERQLLRRNPYGLTFRELTVLHLAAEGKSDKEIGATLGISPLTAQKHVANILCKMGAASRTEASVRAVREGLLD